MPRPIIDGGTLMCRVGVAQGFDRGARGDLAEQGQFDLAGAWCRAGDFGRGNHRAATRVRPGVATAFDHLRGKTVGFGTGFLGIDAGFIGQAQDFECTGPVGEAADKPAFLKARDQAVDTGLDFRPSASFISSKEGATPVAFRRSLIKISNWCCFRVSMRRKSPVRGSYRVCPLVH